MKLDDVTELLPESIQEISRLIGYPAALSLVDTFGGTTLAVAKARTDKGIANFQYLAEAIGQREAETLTRHYGGDMLYIPRCYEALQELRDRELRRRFDEMCADHSANWSVQQLALHFKLADRTVWRILKRPARMAAPEQPALF
ncbi:Mor transcription activator family protein [Pseudogulbenkiania sp. MAI-1]|uniref:Mor transcription activator family protein n=1 Tax=Pseudogulbenkiania sp. MAI-1 TaxID=990370 RepID=UPI00045E8C24|nr:Mor transcription activator family protein [Pseudogulbenkiania sp. MAI-1]